MRELNEINESGELIALNLGGTGTGNEVVTVADFASAISQTTGDVPALVGNVQDDDLILVHDTSADDLVVATGAQVHRGMEVVMTAPLGTQLSRAEFDAAVPSPVLGRQYLLKDGTGNTFMAVWDGTDVWSEKLAMAT